MATATGPGEVAGVAALLDAARGTTGEQQEPPPGVAGRSGHSVCGPHGPARSGAAWGISSFLWLLAASPGQWGESVDGGGAASGSRPGSSSLAVVSYVGYVPPTRLSSPRALVSKALLELPDICPILL